MAAYSGLEATIDLKREIRDQLVLRIRSGEINIHRLIARNRAGFSRAIVKHPNLTLVYPQLKDAFAFSRFVFVVRDPRDNIRSILDRLGISGSESTLSSGKRASLPLAWQSILRGEGLGIESSQHLDVLASRWNLMTATYLDHRESMTLIRYEDFLLDKVKAIEGLGKSLGFDKMADIASLIDRPYQPPGRNRGISPFEFFGAANLGRIERICATGMHILDYRLLT